MDEGMADGSEGEGRGKFDLFCNYRSIDVQLSSHDTSLTICESEKDLNLTDVYALRCLMSVHYFEIRERG